MVLSFHREALAVCLSCGSQRATFCWFIRKFFTLTLHCPCFVIISAKACRKIPTKLTLQGPPCRSSVSTFLARRLSAAVPEARA